MRPIIKLIFEHHKKRWRYRNDREHDEAKHQQIHNLMQRMKWLYSQKEKLSANDRHPFTQRIDEWEKKSPRQIKEWLNHDEQQTISKHRQRKKQVTIHTFFTGKKTSNNVITNNRVGRNIEIPRILAPTRTRKKK